MGVLQLEVSQQGVGITIPHGSVTLGEGREGYHIGKMDIGSVTLGGVTLDDVTLVGGILGVPHHRMRHQGNRLGDLIKMYNHEEMRDSLVPQGLAHAGSLFRGLDSWELAQ